MKSLNVKKIAALAAGTALFAAGIAAAGAITYSNTPIVSESGVPQAKIVVGEQAAATDGVVAANIAAMIGNLAWRTQAVTATVGNKDAVGCTVTGGSGAGTCAISNEKVWLNVTLPGVVSGAVEFRTLISDWVDRKLENRDQTTPDDIYNTLPDNMSPFGYPVPTYVAVKKFTATDFPALQTGAITDTYANMAYTEEQSLWIRAYTKYEDSLKKVVAKEPNMAYQIKFTHDQFGVTVSTCNPQSGVSTPNDPTPPVVAPGAGSFYDKCSDNDLTARHRVLIKFLGEDYIISDMTTPVLTALAGCVADSSENNGNGVCAAPAGGVLEGGSIKLAKESAYGIVHVGENLSTGSYFVKLADITTPTTPFPEGQASIQVYDLNGNLLKEDKVTPGVTYSWTTPDGSKIRIRVYKNNPGYYAYAKWSEMAIYSKEFELTDGQQIADDCAQWKVSLFWKNRDPSKASKYVDSLRRIVLKAQDEYTAVNMVEGDTQNIICSPVVWQLQYNGLALNDPGDYDTLGMTVQTRSFTVNEQPGSTSCTRLGGFGLVPTFAATRLSDANVLRVASSLSQPFSVSATGDGGTVTGTANNFNINLGTNLPIDTNWASGATKPVASHGAKAYGGWYAQTDLAAALTGTAVTLHPTGAGWSSQTTFTVTGYDALGNLVVSQPVTSGLGVLNVVLTPPAGQVWKIITAVTATGGTFGDAFNIYDVNTPGAGVPAAASGLSTDATGTGTFEPAMIGWYNDAGEVIWTQQGETNCDFRGSPTGAITYDMGDGTVQPISFGAPATGLAFPFFPGPGLPAPTNAWCAVDSTLAGGAGYVYAGVGTCQLALTGGALPITERALAWRESAGNSPIEYDYLRVFLQQQSTTGVRFQFVDPRVGAPPVGPFTMDPSPTKFDYISLGRPLSPPSGAQTTGFITERGTKFSSISQTSAAFKTAKKVGEAQYFLKTSGTAPNAPIQVGPLGEGESTTGLAGGIIIKVTQITEDVGTCTAGAGGSTCTVTGLDGLTATPSVTSTVIPTDLDTKATPLVVLDRNADRTATLIVVGGNTVNTVANEIITSSNINLATDTVVVRAIGTNRILVAGYTAQDTMTAGDQFIQALIAAKNA